MIVAQLEGMWNGCNDASQENDISLQDLWLIQSIEDFIQFADLLWPCTALLVPSQDFQDVWFGHDSCGRFTRLNGILKEYHLESSIFVSKHLVFTTRIGRIFSIDGFSVSDSGLFVLQTPLYNFNSNHFSLETALSWMRSYYSTLASSNGSSWENNFIFQDSQSRPSQYLIIDSNNFQPGKNQQDDSFLWLVESIPGLTKGGSITSYFNENNALMLFNVPFFQETSYISDIFEQTHFPNDTFNFNEHPKHKVLQRNISHLKNYENFQQFLRSNTYQWDDLIYQDPGLGIFARLDLRNDTQTKYGSKAPYGCLDTKTAKISEVRGALFFDAISGHNSNSLPLFNFSDFDSIKYHGSLPNSFQFEWTNFSSKSFNRCSGHSKDEDCFDQSGCGWCIYDQECKPGQNDGPQRGFFL